MCCAQHMYAHIQSARCMFTAHSIVMVLAPQQSTNLPCKAAEATYHHSAASTGASTPTVKRNHFAAAAAAALRRATLILYCSSSCSK
jgi:hypothetical protein